MTVEHSSSSVMMAEAPQTGGFIFWQRWLVVASDLTILFGLFMTFFHGTDLFKPFHTQINAVFWNTAVSPEAQAFQSWAYGLMGAVMVGWGIVLYFLARIPFKQQQKWAWNTFLYGLLAWYVLDTAVSLYYGVVFNAFVNTIFLALFLLPLLFTRKDFNG